MECHGLYSKDSRKRRKERAKRFGLSEQTIADRKLDINSLYLRFVELKESVLRHLLTFQKGN